MSKLKSYIKLTRPFTLLPPLLGIISGAVCAFGSAHNPDPARAITGSVLFTIGLGSLCASLLNAASNILNQITDLENDRLNKPDRPLVTCAVSEKEAWVLTWVIYALALVPTWGVVVYPVTGLADKFAAPLPLHECFFLYVGGFLATLIYSLPALGRTKRMTFGANITIAIPRGCLLKVAGWTMVARYTAVEPWFMGGIFMLFLLGAATTKDFSDMEGDREAGCMTLPVRYGVKAATRIIAPFFVLPWLLIPLGVWLRDPQNPEIAILSGNAMILNILGVVLTLWGAYTAWLLVRDPDELARTENHPSWTHMYLMMMCAQIGFAIAYVVV